MKAALLVLAVLQIISGLVTAVAAFTQNIFLGILSTAIVVLSLVPIFALIRCMEELDDLRYQYIRLEGKHHWLEEVLGAAKCPVMMDFETRPWSNLLRKSQNGAGPARNATV